MRIATETVWATADGKLVSAGHAEAAVLVAAKSHPVPDKKLEQFSKSDVSKFFKDAVFDRAGIMEPAKPLKQPEPLTYARLNTPKETKAAAQAEADAAAKRARVREEKHEEMNQSPQPKNREDAQNKRLRKRQKKSRK